MPKTNLGKSSQPDRKLVMLIWGQMAALGVKQAELARKVHMGQDTMLRRRKDPDTFTIGELKKLSRELEIPADDIRAAITFR